MLRAPRLNPRTEVNLVDAVKAANTTLTSKYGVYFDGSITKTGVDADLRRVRGGEALQQTLEISGRMAEVVVHQGDHRPYAVAFLLADTDEKVAKQIVDAVEGVDRWGRGGP